MTHFQFAHDFDVDPPGFWDLFFAEDFNVDLYRALQMKERVVLEHTDDGKTIKRVVRLTPTDDIPPMFKALAPDTRYTEHDLFHRDRSSMDVVIEPAAGKSKFDFKGVYAVRPLGPGRCRRTFEGDVKVSVMIVGGQIERFMVDRMKTSYEIASDVTRRWIRQRATRP